MTLLSRVFGSTFLAWLALTVGSLGNAQEATFPTSSCYHQFPRDGPASLVERAKCYHDAHDDAGVIATYEELKHSYLGSNPGGVLQQGYWAALAYERQNNKAKAADTIRDALGLSGWARSGRTAADITVANGYPQAFVDDFDRIDEAEVVSYKQAAQAAAAKEQIDRANARVQRVAEEKASAARLRQELAAKDQEAIAAKNQARVEKLRAAALARAEKRNGTVKSRGCSAEIMHRWDERLAAIDGHDDAREAQLSLADARWIDSCSWNDSGLLRYNEWKTAVSSYVWYATSATIGSADLSGVSRRILTLLTAIHNDPNLHGSDDQLSQYLAFMKMLKH